MLCCVVCAVCCEQCRAGLCCAALCCAVLCCAVALACVFLVALASRSIVFVRHVDVVPDLSRTRPEHQIIAVPRGLIRDEVSA